MHRRDFLASLTGLTAATAGCLGGGDDGSRTNTDGSETHTDRTRTATARPSATESPTTGTATRRATATSAPPDAEVYRETSSGTDPGAFVAEHTYSGEVYRGDDFIVAMQSAVDSLSEDRLSKESVLVRCSGDTGPHEWDGDTKGVDIPDYTTFACAPDATINVTDTGEPLIIPIRLPGSSHVDIPRINITGNPRYAMNLASVTDVSIGTADIRARADSDAGLGIRIDAGGGSRSQDVSIDYAYVEGINSHAVETAGLDGFRVWTAVETVDTGGCGLLLNSTTDATVETVDATRANEGGGYAGFRCANDAGPNITVNEVRAVDCGRGVFTVSGSRGIEINDVYLDGNGGNLIQDTREMVIDGGTVTNTASSGIRIDSRSSDKHPHTKNVTVRNLDITDNLRYGVYETGPDTEQNAILDCSFCDNADGAIERYAATTSRSGNTDC